MNRSGLVAEDHAVSIVRLLFGKEEESTPVPALVGLSFQMQFLPSQS